MRGQIWTGERPAACDQGQKPIRRPSARLGTPDAGTGAVSAPDAGM